MVIYAQGYPAEPVVELNPGSLSLENALNLYNNSKSIDI